MTPQTARRISWRQEGRTAFFKNYPLDDDTCDSSDKVLITNPYEEGTEAYECWGDGYSDASFDH